jgi:hypothetical protein
MQRAMRILRKCASFGRKGAELGRGFARALRRVVRPTEQSARVEFRTAEGESLAISIPGSEAAVIRHFQKRMPHGLLPGMDARGER